MKQFNLMEYLANPSRKIVTRDGRNVRIICTDKRGTDFPIVALVECEDKEETCYYAPTGCWGIYEEESDIDLFFDSEKKERWVNLYYDKIRNHVYFGKVFKTKEKAKKAGKSQNNYVITIPIEWEE